MSEHEFYREQAAEARRFAAASDLPNVKTRYEIAAQTWQRFAEKAAGLETWRQEFQDRH